MEIVREPVKVTLDTEILNYEYPYLNLRINAAKEPTYAALLMNLAKN